MFNPRYNQSDLKSLIPNMEKFWTSESYTDHNKYWEQQWLQYGTCSHDPERLLSKKSSKYRSIDMAEYFAIALDLFQRFKIKKWLQQEQVLPSNSKSYSKNKILSIIDDHLGQLAQQPKTYELRCTHKHVSKFRNILTEIHFCFNDQLELENCHLFYIPSKYNGACDNEHGLFWIVK